MRPITSRVTPFRIIYQVSAAAAANASSKHMMLCDQHRRPSVDRDRETPGSAMWTSAAEAISSIAAFPAFRLKTGKVLASTHDRFTSFFGDPGRDWIYTRSRVGTE